MFSVLALGVVAVGLLLCIALKSHQKDAYDVQRLPGPPPSIASWIWGHELLVFRHAATQMYTMWARSFGGLFRIKAALFHPDIIVATDHAAVRHIFANSDIYNMIGRGLVWAEGEDWHRQRKILGPVFSSEAVKEMTSVIYESAERLETRLTNLLLDSTSNKEGTCLNITPYISACTLDIIGAVGLSHTFAAQSTRPGSDAEQIFASWTQHVNNGLQRLAFLAPLVVRAVPVVTKAPLPLMRSQGVIKTIVTRIGRRIIERERAALGVAGKDSLLDISSNDSGRMDIISVLLRNRRLASASEKLSDTQILDNVCCFLSSPMVGHETTAGSLAFTLWELARHPEIQNRLRAEILAHGRDLSYEEIQKLEYLDAVVREGLRIHPASPQTERLILQDDVIPLTTAIPGIGDSVRVKKGQVIHIPFIPMNTNPSVWGPSGAVFDPSRWLTVRDPAAPALPHGWSGMLTFCDGPRSCLGLRLAVLEFKIILATIVRSIAFADTGVHVEEKISPTLQPVVNGRGGYLPLRLKLI
ncbi:cytochrome P450 [Mycena pura]|uniref:Cytochrome P450 n=1 Tax=Mycena pura TaxID=153505 RepID=A0AAD6V0A2_9AGAR|nr:cytochrome P450 [Mycena pura]